MDTAGILPESTPIGRRIETDTGFGSVLLAGPGAATSLGDGRRTTMERGSLLAKVGFGVRALPSNAGLQPSFTFQLKTEM
jgi:hypothetical protein